MSRSYTVLSICLIFVAETSQCGEGPYAHNTSSTELVVTDGVERDVNA